MTMILSFVTPTVVLQVSDRRFSYIRGGRIVARDDGKNKAIVYCGRVAFAFTGLGEISGKRTDIWIANVLAEAGKLDAGFELLRERCTETFKHPSMAGFPLGIVATGWSRQPPDGKLAPFYSIVSNFFVDGRWVPEVNDSFLWNIEVAPERRMGLFDAGRSLDPEDRQALVTNLRNLIEEGSGTSDVIRLLAEKIRERARSDQGVGENLLVNSIPKDAVPDTDGEMTLISGGPIPARSTFLYLPSGTDDGLRYGPTAVCGGAVITDFEAGPLKKTRDQKAPELDQERRHYYLCPYGGTGTKEHPFRPRGTDEFEGWGSIDLRPSKDQTRRTGYALVATPAPLAEDAGLYLGTDPDRNLTEAERGELQRLLAAILKGPLRSETLREIVAELLIEHADDDSVDYPNRLRPGVDGIRRIYLGGLLWTDQP